MTVKRALYFINREHAYAYTSIMTVMNRLVKKSFLIREKKGHSYIYTPIMSKSEFITYAAGLIVSELKKDFGGEISGILDTGAKKKSRRK